MIGFIILGTIAAIGIIVASCIHGEPVGVVAGVVLLIFVYVPGALEFVVAVVVVVMFLSFVFGA